MNVAHITAKNQHDSLLLRLPSELRNKIFAQALGSFKIQLRVFGDNNKRIPDIWFSYEDSEPKLRRTLKYVDLNQVCRQLRHDTSGLHVSLNTFVGSPQELTYFMD